MTHGVNNRDGRKKFWPDMFVQQFPDMETKVEKLKLL